MMFGHQYHVTDTRLAAGDLSKAEYASELLANIVNRARPLRFLVEKHAGGSALDPEVFYEGLVLFLEDLDELRARTIRGGLGDPYGPDGMFPKSPTAEIDTGEADQLGGAFPEPAE